MIEGDNLEVLKLLQKSYAGKVKLIYIDPPYNTGKDFVYPDNFRDSIGSYLELTEQVQGGVRMLANTESSGRFHTDWLNMIYPRLRLARSLLRQDGIIFISIDDAEMPKLRFVCDEIFGEENFLGCFIWKSRQNKDNRTVTGASIDHEYVICYGNAIRGSARNTSQYSNPDNDSRGDWASANMVGIATADRRPNLHYDLIHPETGINYGCPDMGWRYDRNTMGRLISENRIIWPSEKTGRPRRKAFLNELESDFTGFSTMIGSDIYTKHGTEDIDGLFNVRVFNFPKPVKLISTLVEQGSGDGDIVIDFFAGSGTTAHAVMEQNASDGANRRFIVVQLPEPLSPDNPEQKTASDYCDSLGQPRTIAELTKERLRRSGKKVKSENSLFMGDIGFRVFKLDKSNIRLWSPDPENLSQTLLDHHEHILQGRTEADIVYELLLKLGLDLCVPMESRIVAGKTIEAVGGGVLMLCLAEKLAVAEVEAVAAGIVAWHKELAPAGDSTVVFRDSAFDSDVAKTNMAAILAQNGLENVRSL
jgi:adenine-specific DNA-methyltransferase